MGAPSTGAGGGSFIPSPTECCRSERLAVWLWFAQVDTKVFVDVDAKKVGNLIGPKGATLHQIQVPTVAHSSFSALLGVRPEIAGGSFRNEQAGRPAGA